MEIQEFDINPFKSIYSALSFLKKVKLMDVTIKSNGKLKGDTEFDNLMNWIVISKFLKTLYEKHNGLTLYSIKVKSVNLGKGEYVSFNVEQSLNDITIYTNIEWNINGKLCKSEDMKFSETLRGLANVSKDIFWKVVLAHYFYYYFWDNWNYVYFRLKRLAELDSFPD